MIGILNISIEAGVIHIVEKALNKVGRRCMSGELTVVNCPETSVFHRTNQWLIAVTGPIMLRYPVGSVGLWVVENLAPLIFGPEYDALYILLPTGRGEPQIVPILLSDE